MNSLETHFRQISVVCLQETKPELMVTSPPRDRDQQCQQRLTNSSEKPPKNPEPPTFSELNSCLLSQKCSFSRDYNCAALGGSAQTGSQDKLGVFGNLTTR